MDQIIFTVERDEESGALIACWDVPGGGGITTQGNDLEELQRNLREAVRCHFADAVPGTVRLHFAQDPLLAMA